MYQSSRLPQQLNRASRAPENTIMAKSSNPEAVNVDRRCEKDERRADDRRQENSPVEAERRAAPRRKVQRRRQIDPTTCERDYTNDEIEFMQALDDYKRSSGRMFPTCSEILEVIRNMGYTRDLPADEAAPANVSISPEEATAAEEEAAGDAEAAAV